ncbi:MAG: DUF2284 domain-containing protein [Lachnospiraceae bacterium]
MDLERITKEAREYGFTHAHQLDAASIELRQEVRDMCAANTCGQYGTSWSCPPGCGELSECEAKVRKYTTGILVQTVGELEDELDGEGMMEAEARHKKAFLALKDELKKEFPALLPLGAGACRICKTCTYPDAPCRFPDKAVSSMEAFGMLVSQVCTANDVPYYYGRNTIAYTSCFLLE